MIPIAFPLIAVGGKVLISLTTKEIAIIAATYTAKKYIDHKKKRDQ